MKSPLICMCAFLLWGSSWGKNGDTLEVHTHQNVLIQTDPSRGNTKYYGWGNFPKEGTYQRVYAELSFKCPDNLRCGEWDYLNYIYLRTRKGNFNDTLNWEIMRFITPYGFGFNKAWNHTWRFDITDFESLLRDSVEIEYQHTGYEAKNDRGWIIDLKFVFVEGKPLRDVLGIKRMYQKSVPFGDDAVFEQQTPDVTWKPTPGTETSRIKIIQTGHGMDQPSNCAEFCPRYRYLWLDGNYVDTSLVWRDDCGANPVYPQNGTWIYDRSAWCPGQNVDEYNFDFKEKGDSIHTFDLDMQSYTKTSGNSNYVITCYLVEYGPFNYTNDAAILDVIQPSKHPQYLRYNPICSEPIITVRNNGTIPVYSLDIEYGISGGSLSKHHWVGVLPFGGTAQVRLPYKMDWTPVSEHFEARIVKSNGNTDKDESNNYIKVAMPAPPKLLPAKVVVMFRTNVAFKETSWRLLDAGGNVYKARNNFNAANTIYRDTLNLYNGCFTFVVDDSGEPPAEMPLNEDGLNWWANSFDGNGAVQLRNADNGSLIHNFIGDFGSEIRLDFSVGYKVDIDKMGSYSTELRAYPNPSDGNFMIDIPERFVKNTSPATLEIVDLQGKIIQSQTITQINNALLMVNTEKIAKGMYLVKLKQNHDLCTTKVLLR